MIVKGKSEYSIIINAEEADKLVNIMRFVIRCYNETGISDLSEQEYQFANEILAYLPKV